MASHYNPVTPELIAKLKAVAGDKNVRCDEETLTQYQTDEEGNPHYFRKPEVVVFPETTEQVAAIVKLANEFLVPITPRAAGTNVACGAIPIYHGIVLEVEKMNKILDLNEEALYCTAQCGVSTNDLQAAARARGLLYAGDPSSSENCAIGGNVANNAGGNKAVKYGTTRNQIYSVKVVTPTGDILTAGARLQKCSTGLALEQLFAGSEGALGIITEVTVKLRPLPPYSFNMVCVFKDPGIHGQRSHRHDQQVPGHDLPPCGRRRLLRHRDSGIVLRRRYRPKDGETRRTGRSQRFCG